MKFIRLVLGILALAGTCLMGGIIYSLLKEHHDNKYVPSGNWDNEYPY